MLSQREEQAVELRQQGLSQMRIAGAMGVSRRRVRELLASAENKGVLDESTIARLQRHTGGDFSKLHSTWLKSEPDKNGMSESVYLFFGKPREEAEETFEEITRETIELIKDHAYAYSEVAPAEDAGRHLAVVDPADVHIGKLSVATETGHEYNNEIAAQRMTEGSSRLMEKARVHGVDHIVLAIGNDILNADRWNGTTTSGTPQDTDGLWHQWFRHARDAYVKLIETLAQDTVVHLIFCPSNHDWQTGFYLAQTLGAWFRNHPNVRTGANDHYLSPLHRKYFVYHENLLGFTHGDGAKESDLPNLMQLEAREFWSSTRHAHWYTHHAHHKDRKRTGLTTQLIEKDLTGVTLINPATSALGGSVEVEVVRSPSAPDGWHHRNGYVNLQAVECYLHDPTAGQVARFTEFF